MPRNADEAYDSAVAASLPFSWRQGCRGHPDVPLGFELLIRSVEDARGRLADASGCLGLPGRAATQADATVLEPSAVALDALAFDRSGDGAGIPERTAELHVEAGLAWDLPAGAYDRVVLYPPAERGTVRVEAEIAAAAAALRADGELILLLEKDRGAKRYERLAAGRFAEGGVTERSKGLRLSRWRAPRGEATAPDPWLRFEVEGRPTRALAGCYAAGKLDPGTRVLLAALAEAGAPAAGTRVLDVGCGWGPLARAAADAGAQVVALDDDLAAVRSCRANVPEATVLHRDATRRRDDVPEVDLALVNPPFHVGRGVRTELAVALLRTARSRLRPGGELWWVENRDLRHARASGLEDATEVADEAGFRVLRVRGRSSR